MKVSAKKTVAIELEDNEAFQLYHSLSYAIADQEDSRVTVSPMFRELVDLLREVTE